jgi:hypothetical protein
LGKKNYSKLILLNLTALIWQSLFSILLFRVLLFVGKGGGEKILSLNKPVPPVFHSLEKVPVVHWEICRAPVAESLFRSLVQGVARSRFSTFGVQNVQKVLKLDNRKILIYVCWETCRKVWMTTGKDPL